MRIAYVAAGAAGMYCGTCMHDNTLAAALGRLGHEVALIPTYTPLRTDEPDVSIDRVFFGALNVYLQQKSALFRRTPGFVDRLFDSHFLLDQLGRFGAATDAHDLGALTLSVLQGREGNQAKELGKLAGWLRDFSPDLVQLTNSMFLGFAASIRQATGAPVVCGLTGEDVFLDQLDEPWRGAVQAELRRRAADADGFIATSRYYAELMTETLGVEGERMHVVPLGIVTSDLAGTVGAAAAGGRGEEAAGGGEPGPFTVGYLARLCPEKGLHLLVEAFRLLAAEAGAERVRLRVAGYCGPRDRDYVYDQRARIDAWGLGGRVDWVGEVDRAGKVELLAGLDALSVPTVHPEPKGLYVLEALAAGVPVVEPSHGAFPELIAATGGGLLVEPGSPESLAEALGRLAADRALGRQLGHQGRLAVRQRFGAEAMAERTLAVYRAVIDRHRPVRAAG
jgi:glycosyltransferase involved in cell wall biosynthesis